MKLMTAIFNTGFGIYRHDRDRVDKDWFDSLRCWICGYIACKPCPSAFTSVFSRCTSSASAVDASAERKIGMLISIVWYTVMCVWI